MGVAIARAGLVQFSLKYNTRHENSAHLKLRKEYSNKTCRSAQNYSLKEFTESGIK